MKSVTTVSLSQVGSRRTWSAREDMRLSRSHGKTPCTLTVRIVFLALMPFQGAKIGDQKSSMQHYLGDGGEDNRCKNGNRLSAGVCMGRVPPK